MRQKENRQSESMAKNTRVLFVCMGNICRSPMAEGVFRKLVREAGLEDSRAGRRPPARMRSTPASRRTSARSRRPLKRGYDIGRLKRAAGQAG